MAARYLEAHGYQILARNFRARYGEVDLVARHADAIVFVEVRTRRSHAFGTPEESVTPRKMQRLVAVAQQYLQDHSLEHLTWRVDLVAIFPGPPEVTVSHLQGIDTQR